LHTIGSKGKGIKVAEELRLIIWPAGKESKGIPWVDRITRVLKSGQERQGREEEGFSVRTQLDVTL
jgi:hypothetical protein